jgi:hypothetical protein
MATQLLNHFFFTNHIQNLIYYHIHYSAMHFLLPISLHVSLFVRYVNEVIQSGRNVRQPLPDACSVCQKINYIEITKQKSYINCWMCPSRSSMYAFTVFRMCDAIWRKVCHGNVSPGEKLSICLAQEDLEMYP